MEDMGESRGFMTRQQPMQRNDRNFIRRNEQIRMPKVRLIKDGENLGVVPTHEAIRLAREEGLDLVEVAPLARPPVCHILDYGKYKFTEQKKAKDKQKVHVRKEREVQLRYVISDHDLNTKIKIMERIINAGDKLKLVIRFKSRENAHKDQGMIVIMKCLDRLGSDVVIETPPALDGKQIIARVYKKQTDTNAHDAAI